MSEKSKRHKGERKAFLEMKKELQKLAREETNPAMKELREKTLKNFCKNKGFETSYEDFDAEGDFEW